MNVKGLKLTKEFIRKLYSQEEEIHDVKECIEPFVEFQWKGFDNNEFFHLINSFEVLDKAGFFDFLPDDYLFVFNFDNNVAEMDIVTIFADKDGNDIFLDIEVKNGELSEVSNKLSTQLNKRIESQMSEFLKSGKYLLIGLVNDSFFTSYFNDGNERIEYKDIDSLLDNAKNFIPEKSVDTLIYQKSEMASLYSIWEIIKNGTYSYYEDTDKHYKYIEDNIPRKKAIFIYGDAGTGKSVLALRLFAEHQKEAKLLVVNSKLYYTLDLGFSFYSSGKAMFNTKKFIENLSSDDLAIVDECQRLSLEDMKMIVEKSKCAVFFGDEKQAWSENSTDLNSKALCNEFEKSGFYSCCKKLTKSKRYSDETNKAITSLLFPTKPADAIKLPYGYTIYITFKPKTFLKMFKEADGLKKLYCPYTDSTEKTLKIDQEEFPCASRTDDNFSAKPDSSKYGNTYHALSFDVDDCFVFLPYTKEIEVRRKSYLFTSRLKMTEKNIWKYQNELNILFTRGRKSLTICAEDITAYLLLRKRWLRLKNGK